MTRDQITNPAPAPLATCPVVTDSGIVTTVCEPINDVLAITPTFGMDAEGNSLLDGRFVITHRPTGWLVSDGPGCVECCRSAGKAIDRLGLDWSALTPETSSEWVAALTEEQRVKFHSAREVNWNCSAYTCSPWPDDATDTVVAARLAHRAKLAQNGGAS